ncbi:hypothetical protein BOTBODRAFT_172461 [Botryobasidium botryosum FD-172 SS1]|uniref:Uncharacterized protein n=1 Tax=Botryobasidium botryosum (strain FD-172 SS1) TaxID=930990 RepID=A0A067MZV9_BOTB1|nr:hypothetical protein BOTBODRAFT_172461 [Botryobasidium botryosum FD-172 SS1]
MAKRDSSLLLRRSVFDVAKELGLADPGVNRWLYSGEEIPEEAVEEVTPAAEALDVATEIPTPVLTSSQGSRTSLSTSAASTSNAPSVSRTPPRPAQRSFDFSPAVTPTPRESTSNASDTSSRASSGKLKKSKPPQISTSVPPVTRTVVFTNDEHPNVKGKVANAEKPTASESGFSSFGLRKKQSRRGSTVNAEDIPKKRSMFSSFGFRKAHAPPGPSTVEVIKVIDDVEEPKEINVPFHTLPPLDAALSLLSPVPLPPSPKSPRTSTAFRNVNPPKTPPRRSVTSDHTTTSQSTVPSLSITANDTSPPSTMRSSFLSASSGRASWMRPSSSMEDNDTAWEDVDSREDHRHFSASVVKITGDDPPPSPLPDDPFGRAPVTVIPKNNNRALSPIPAGLTRKTSGSLRVGRTGSYKRTHIRRGSNSVAASPLASPSAIKIAKMGSSPNRKSEFNSARKTRRSALLYPVDVYSTYGIPVSPVRTSSLPSTHRASSSADTFTQREGAISPPADGATSPPPGARGRVSPFPAKPIKRMSRSPTPQNFLSPPEPTSPPQSGSSSRRTSLNTQRFSDMPSVLASRPPPPNIPLPQPPLSGAWEGHQSPPRNVSFGRAGSPPLPQRTASPLPPSPPRSILKTREQDSMASLLMPSPVNPSWSGSSSPSTQSSLSPSSSVSRGKSPAVASFTSGIVFQGAGGSSMPLSPPREMRQARTPPPPPPVPLPALPVPSDLNSRARTRSGSAMGSGLLAPNAGLAHRSSSQYLFLPKGTPGNPHVRGRVAEVASAFEEEQRRSMASVYTCDTMLTEDGGALETKGPVGIEAREKLVNRVRGMNGGGNRYMGSYL